MVCEEVCEAALAWAVWDEEVSNPDSSPVSEAVSAVVCEVDSEVEVALAVPVHFSTVDQVDTWLLAETSVTTCMPITMVPRVVLLALEVLLPSHLDSEPSPPSLISRSSFETYVS